MLQAGMVRVAGTMSGTSLDGVDAAVIETDGERIAGFGPSAYRPYSDAERSVLRAALGQWEGAAVAAAARVVEEAHAEVLADLIASAGPVDMVGFHGQTLAHDPRRRGTLQAGDGAWLAERLSVPVAWDFRSTDVRLGGQGAPLAPFYHFALAKWARIEAPMTFLNLGGVGNLTWVNPAQGRPELPGALVAFDTGPANAPLDDLMLARRSQARDEGGRLAATGTVDEGVLEGFLAHPWFFRMPPKSLDRGDFAGLSDAVTGLADEDAAATLLACVAAAVMRGMEHCPRPPARMLVTGGGRHNATLMAMLAAAVDCPVTPVEDVGLDGDMLEAQAFGHLAVRVARGLPTSCPGTTGVSAAVGGGTISTPRG
ncbi:MAG: anhydro-N-acetylmuramic acid kinase [Rubellimicrobium sp.]|nr:anhydro-N-acetylmuramic acid kinase [Rubellimicrobium sp.]